MIDRRIRPEHALQPGRADAARLLVVWFVRKSFYWLAAVGTFGAVLTGRSPTPDWSSAESIISEALSPLAGVILALVARFASNMAGLALAYPLARTYEVGLAPRTNIGHSIGEWFDRLHLARSYRALRWTHHVRQLALERIGPAGERVAKLDPVMDVVNIGSWVVTVVALLVLGVPTQA